MSISILCRRASVLTAIAGWSLSGPAVSENRSLEIHFVATSQGAPFNFDQFEYSDPVGGESIMLRDFRFYASGLKLRNATAEFVEADSYHLIRFDARSNADKIVVENVPMRDIDEIEISIGLDPEANGSIMPRGDLDPNSRMAWNWEIGYKFLLGEGALMNEGTIEPLVYHVGFNESFRTITLPVSLIGEDMSLSLEVEILGLFAGEHTIDMSALPTVKMNRKDASMLADNFARILSISSER